MKMFLRLLMQSFVVSLLLSLTLKACTSGDVYPREKPTQNILRKAIPPPPPIYSPVLPTVEESLLGQVAKFFTGPCDPILPAFVEAHDIVAVHPMVIKVIDPRHVGHFNMGQLCDAFDYLSKHWKPFDDPQGRELVAHTNGVWEYPGGDCDEFSVALSAGLSSIGAVTRVTFAYSAYGEGHAFVEVCLGHADVQVFEEYLRSRYDLSESTKIQYREDGKGLIYLNLDWTAPHPGGRYFSAESGAQYYPSNKQCFTFQ